MAISIAVRKAKPGYDLGASKFFGTPTIPGAWEDSFSEDEIFFCQIRLGDIAALDPENRLPHTGYLYVFLHTGEGNRGLTADVRCYAGEPDMALADFNAAVEGYEAFNDAWLMEFTPGENNADGIRLFGDPSDWNYAQQPPKLLLQYDPLDSDMGFLDTMDGYGYLFFGKDNRNFTDVQWHTEYS